MSSSTGKIRVLIVDDEPLGRTVIREMLRPEAGIEVIGECATGQEAIEGVRALRPDLVFLDVQMPEMDGFEALAALGSDELPLVVFVTAYDQYAVRAFEVHAVDYLLKPFDRERFARAVDHARAQLRREREGAVNERILALLESRARHLERVVVKSNGRVFFLKTEEIDWIGAEGNYVSLHVRKETYLLRETIGGIEAQLDPARFPRIHRSQIVNLDRIRELRPWSHGEYHVILHDGTQLTLSRSYRDRLQKLLGGGL